MDKGKVTRRRRGTAYFSMRLEQLRAAAHLTAQDLGQIAGVTPATVQTWLAGQSQGPRIDQLLRIADYFGIPTIDELVRPVPGGSQQCTVPKRLLYEMLTQLEPVTKNLQRLLEENPEHMAPPTPDEPIA